MLYFDTSAESYDYNKAVLIPKQNLKTPKKMCCLLLTKHNPKTTTKLWCLLIPKQNPKTTTKMWCLLLTKHTPKTTTKLSGYLGRILRLQQSCVVCC